MATARATRPPTASGKGRGLAVIWRVSWLRSSRAWNIGAAGILLTARETNAQQAQGGEENDAVEEGSCAADDGEQAEIAPAPEGDGERRDAVGRHDGEERQREARREDGKRCASQAAARRHPAP